MKTHDRKRTHFLTWLRIAQTNVKKQTTQIATWIEDVKEKTFDCVMFLYFKIYIYVCNQIFKQKSRILLLCDKPSLYISSQIFSMNIFFTKNLLYFIMIYFVILNFCMSLKILLWHNWMAKPVFMLYIFIRSFLLLWCSLCKIFVHISNSFYWINSPR